MNHFTQLPVQLRSVVFLTGIFFLLTIYSAFAQITSGAKDVTFGTLGSTYTAAGFTPGSNKNSCIDSKGRILVVGYTYTAATNKDMVVVRLTSSGQLDNSFDTDGMKTISYGMTDERAYAVTTSGDKIVIAGIAINGGVTLQVIRLLEDGSMDNTFDTDGISSISIPGGNYSYPTTIVVDAQDKIIIGGQSAATNSDFCLVKLTTSGSLDNTFNTTGILTVDFGAYEYPTAMVTTNGGEIYLAGHTSLNTTTYFDFIVLKVNAAGDLVTGFDTDGKASYSLGSENDEANGMAMDASGRLVLVGKFHNSGSNMKLGLIRINATTGVLDNTFGVSGYNILDAFSGADVVGNDVVIDNTGQILVATSTTDFNLIRLKGTDGSYDNTFGTNAISTINFVPASSSVDLSRSLLMDKAGRLVVIGSVNFTSQNYIGLTRVYNYAPVLTASASFTDFTTLPASASAGQTYVIEGIYVPDSVAVESPVGYELSLDGISYSSNIFYITTTANGIISPLTVHVRLKSGLTEGNYSGIIDHYSNEASSNVSVNGIVSAPAGMEEIEVQNGFSVYPVPAVHELTIETLQPIEFIQIKDLSGKLISEKINASTISVETIPPGTYLLEIKAGGNNSYGKIVIE